MIATLGTRRRRKSTRNNDALTLPAPAPLATLDDAQLLHHPDPAEAFTVLYERYAPRVTGYCLSRVGNPAEAEEIAAQALAKAWAGFPPDHRGTFRAWLFTIAHHTIVDHYRVTARAPGQAGEAHLATLASPAPGPDEASVAAETREELIAAVAALPDDQQQAITLRIAGLKGREVAEVMGRSHQAVKMLQFRAITSLRTSLAATSTLTGEEDFR